MLRKTVTASSPSFMLLGGVASLPSGHLVRGLLNQPKPSSRRLEVAADWDYFYFRSHGIGAPQKCTKSKRRTV